MHAAGSHPAACKKRGPAVYAEEVKSKLPRRDPESNVRESRAVSPSVHDRVKKERDSYRDERDSLALDLLAAQTRILELERQVGER